MDLLDKVNECLTSSFHYLTVNFDSKSITEKNKEVFLDKSPLVMTIVSKNAGFMAAVALGLTNRGIKSETFVKESGEYLIVIKNNPKMHIFVL